MGDAPLVSPKKYCNVTFLSIGDAGPDGLPITRLLRCSHCQETYYCGREQQRRHWKVHKFVCRSPRDDIGEERLENFGMSDVAEAIKIIFNPAWNGTTNTDTILSENTGRPFLFLLKRLQVLCYEERGIALSEEDIASANSMVKFMVALLLASSQIIERLWAIPGMTTFLLNLELMSSAMRERKLAAAVPSDEELLNSVANDLSISDSSCFFAMIMCIFFEASFAKYVTLFDNDNSPQYRNTAVATCAARKMMQLYADPYTRCSLPCHPFLSPRMNRFPAGFQLLLEFLPVDPLDSAAVVPGLTVHAMFQILVNESCWHDPIGNIDYAPTFHQMLKSASAKPKAWEAFSVEARASTAHKLLGLYSRCGSQEDEYSCKQAHGCLTGLFLNVVGYDFINGTSDDAMWLRVVKFASKPEFGPYSESFYNWFAIACAHASKKLDNLVNETGVSLELLPPPVMAHIVDYAIDPFGFEPQLMDKMWILPVLLEYNVEKEWMKEMTIYNDNN